MEPRTITNKTLGVKATLVEPVTQGHLERFGAHMAEEQTGSASQRRGANVRSALSAGWFVALSPEMTPTQVSDQDPRVVRLLGDWIDRVYAEVTTIPPE